MLISLTLKVSRNTFFGLVFGPEANLEGRGVPLSIRDLGYSLAKRISFSSARLLSWFSGLMQVLTILKLNEYGMDLVIVLR